MKPDMPMVQLKTWSLAVFLLLAVVVITISAVRQSSTLHAATASASADPTRSPTPTALSTAEISLRYNNALEATAQAVFQRLPTLTPRSDLPVYQAEREQKSSLWSQALNTAIAIYPTPPGFDPRSLKDPTHPPAPTHVIPGHVLGQGTLFDIPSIEPPCNMIRTVNAWHGEIAGEKMRLCAGRVKDLASDAGILIVETQTGDPDNPVHDDLYYLPLAVGAVGIIDIQGTTVILRSTAGELLAVDVAAHQWVTPTPETVIPIPSP